MNGSNPGTVVLYLTPDSSGWYDRNLDEHIKSLQQKKKGGKYAVIASGITKATYGFVTGILFMAANTGAFVSSVLISLTSGSDLPLESAHQAGKGNRTGMELVNNATITSQNTINYMDDFSDSYRFVRFLPEYAWIGWHNKTASFPYFHLKKGDRVFQEHPLQIMELNNIMILFFPDIYE